MVSAELKGWFLRIYRMNPAESPKVSVERTPGDIWLTI